MTEYAEVPQGVLAELRRICLALPETYEEQAWAGTRWRVRGRTFAHVLTIDEEQPPAYARAAGVSGPVTVVTFRAADPEYGVLAQAGPPFFRPRWGSDVIGLMLDDGTDWVEVGELLTESYCVLAPRKLVALVPRPEVP
ncbi:MAG TPA: MmcQ/YjbR family DNA-binding protein [Pseudonocardiaceae bacterium]